MKETTTLAIIWVAVSVTVIAAIVITGRLLPLGAFMIPALLNSKRSENEEEPENE